MTHPSRLVPLISACLFAMPLAAPLALGSHALAQQAIDSGSPSAANIDPAARQVLQTASGALADAPGFGAQFRMFGEGSDLIKSTMPSMSGRFVFGKHSGQRVIHMLGEAKDTADSDSYAFDLTRTPDTLMWTDDERETVFERRATPEPRNMPGSARMILVKDIIDPSPFAGAIGRSTDITLEGTKQVAGIECDVVLMTFRKNPGVSHTGERWYFGKADGLPRRFEQITDAGMIKFSLIMEFSGLVVGPQAPAMLDVRRPDNYTVDSRLDQPGTNAARPANIQREPAESVAKPAAPARVNAPVFSFTDDTGNQYDNNTQLGRVTVLYFWGTWCLVCHTVSPEMSRMAERFSDQGVDVLGIAIRERDPEAARSYMSRQKYAHGLVLDADETAGDFRVQIYPTVVVIDAEGKIAYTGSPGRDRSATDLAGEVARAIQDALDAG